MSCIFDTIFDGLEIIFYIVIAAVAAVILFFVIKYLIKFIKFIIDSISYRNYNSHRFSVTSFNKPTQNTATPQTQKSTNSKRNADYFLYFEDNPGFHHFTRNDGYLFENFVKEIYIKLGFSLVAHCGQTVAGKGNLNDNGADLIFEKNGTTYIMQCKCYATPLSKADVAQYTYRKTEIENILKHDVVFVLVTNNYLDEECFKFCINNSINFIVQDQLRALYSVSEKISDDCAIGYCLNFTEFGNLAALRLSEVGDELTISTQTKKTIIFNNALKKRGNGNNIFYRLDKNDTMSLCLNYLYLPYTCEFSGKILKIDSFDCILSIQLYKPTPLQHNYTELLNFLKPKVA